MPYKWEIRFPGYGILFCVLPAGGNGRRYGILFGNTPGRFHTPLIGVLVYNVSGVFFFLNVH